MQEINLIGILSAGGSLPIIEELHVTENGEYHTPEGIDGYNPVTVNVEGPVIEELHVTENGEYHAPEGVDGYNPVIVQVDPNCIRLVATENGTYHSPSGVDGFVPVVVNVPQIEGVRIGAQANNRIELAISDSPNYEYTLEFYNDEYQAGTSILGNPNSSFNINLTQYGNSWNCDNGNQRLFSYMPSSLDEFKGHFIFVSNASSGNYGLGDRDVALLSGDGELIHKFGTKGTNTPSTNSIWLLSRIDSGIATKSVIKRFKIYDKVNNVTIAEFIPSMQVVNGVKYTGLLNTIDNTFKFNAFNGIIGSVIF